MYTPYDWQEGIANRASYIEGKLKHGAPVVAVSIESGILVLTYRRQARKVYEVYDRLAFAGIGQQSDVEALRVAAVEFTHQEGYNRSEQDVTIQRVAAAMSAPLKKAFGDFTTAPFVARSLFAEVGESPEDDLYYALDYDGDYTISRRCAAIAGTDPILDRLLEGAAKVEVSLGIENALEALTGVWNGALDPEDEVPDEEQSGNLKQEALLIERSETREDRFRWLTPPEI